MPSPWAARAVISLDQNPVGRRHHADPSYNFTPPGWGTTPRPSRLAPTHSRPCASTARARTAPSSTNRRLRRALDAVIVTGPMAVETAVVHALRARIDFVAPVTVYPGEDLLRALAEGAFRVLDRTEDLRTYE